MSVGFKARYTFAGRSSSYQNVRVNQYVGVDLTG